VKNRRKRRAKGQSDTPSELALLRRIERVVAWNGRQSSGIRLGIGDDAWLWVPRKGYETVFTTDWFLEGSHFLRNVHPPKAVGWKCLARAISDVAAMGGEPRCCLVSVALPLDCTKTWLAAFLEGLSSAARKLRCPIAGGDTTRFREILINVCVIGEVKGETAIRRSGARVGDRIFVSGRLGEAELGLKVLKKKKTVASVDGSLLRKHLYPTPRIELGRWLASDRLTTAMMDLSDGLSSDLTRLCGASGVGARIFADRLPIAKGAFARRFEMSERLNAALHSGDDYELLFCTTSKAAAKIPRKFSGIELTQIGEITRHTGIQLVELPGKATPLLARGWDSFRK